MPVTPKLVSVELVVYPPNLAKVKMFVAPLKNANSMPVKVAAVLQPVMLAKTKILLFVDCGVIVALNPVVASVALVLDAAVPVVPLTICNIRNAPRRSFICAAVSTAPVLNDAGKFVGVAISTPVC